MNLTQQEADRLMTMEKIADPSKDWDFPAPGERISVPLTSRDQREHFLLDVTRYQIKLTKASYQNRVHTAIILYRLDIDGAPHRNPDRIEIACPHLHVYREGYGDKWAIPVPADVFTNTANLFTSLDDFMRHRRIVEAPYIQRGLFA